MSESNAFCKLDYDLGDFRHDKSDESYLPFAENIEKLHAISMKNYNIDYDH